MEQENTGSSITKFDAKEFEFPETLFVRDIENRVFHGIVLHSLSEIEGITLLEGNFINTLLGGSLEGIKGISAEQDNKSQSVTVKVEVNVDFGLSIPAKAEEIQTKIAEKITSMTGLHVACVHVVFKNINSSVRKKSLLKEGKGKTLSPEIIDEAFLSS